MSLDIVEQNSSIKNLLDGWIETERNGVESPVLFEAAWQITGYARKDHAKRKLLSKKSQLVRGVDFSSDLGKTAPTGRPVDEIQLTCDAFKQFCLMAETEEGRTIRQYFIEAEKKWRLVQKVAPEVAQQVELMAMQIELAKLQTQITLSEERQLATRHWAATVAPKAIGDRVLGVKEIRTTEYTRTIVDQSGHILNAGKTLNKGRLCQEFGFISRSGKPDYKAINALINEAIEHGAIATPWREVTTLASLEFDASLLPTLKQYYEASPCKRQMWVGE